MCNWTEGYEEELARYSACLALLKEETARIRAALDNARVGFNGSARFVGLLGPQPFLITPEQWQTLCVSGHATWNWIKECSKLYCRALEGAADLDFARALIEGEADTRLVEINRKVALSGRLRPPCFVRLDMPILGQAVEAQIPGSGWGYRLALTQAFTGYAHPAAIETFVAAVQALTGKAHPRVVHVRRKPELGSDETYFAQAVRRAGVEYRMTVREVPPPSEADLILRHYFSDFMTFAGADAAIAAYLSGELAIEPPPSLLTDQKVGMVFPFDPRTAQYFPENIRALFPETRLAQPEDISRVMAQPGSKRNFVLKYAGINPEMRAQGKQVYNLSQCSRTKALTLEEQIKAARPRQPWILQRLVQEKYAILGEDTSGGNIAMREWHARITPIFALSETKTRVMFCTANFRNFWKVSGHADSMLLPVTVADATANQKEISHD